MPTRNDLSERTRTVREALRAELESGPLTAHELSAAVGIREKDVAQHLAHLAKSLEAGGRRLQVRPASCIACGFEFKDRQKLTTPSRCPSCGSERIDPPSFEIAR